MNRKMNKTSKNNFITYGIVILLFAVVQILSSTGNLSRLLNRTSCSPLCVRDRGGISEPRGRFFW